MDNNNLSDLYFKWMCSMAFPDERIRSHYYNTLNILNSIDFRYSMPLDGNRLADGIDLRYHFSYASKIPYDIVVNGFDNTRCSVLEMMIALARRCEDSIMANSEYGDRTHEWFWEMFCNLGLAKFSIQNWNEYSEEIVVNIINNFLDRNYEYDGTGNLFKFNNPKEDVRYIEIWDQMCFYMSEIVENDSRI